ncbi:216_t:CDS:2 [Funneliformis geosporum]|uniref:216_t:CDS:1 n=1 Tax=Funneliformis geosporum TaxID=1117311 RepID=A0A9W4T1W1_9GLOM|nr:216_t:CDS:2 [Funneliformis geosporum]
MAAKLPSETLQHIFNYINDTKTLYSIIQVNHDWCQNGIKFLWKEPFRNDIKLKNHIMILPILLAFVNYEKVLKTLENNNEPLLEEKEDFQSLSEPLLFNYPYLITHLDFHHLSRIILIFFKKSQYFKSSNKQQEREGSQITNPNNKAIKDSKLVFNIECCLSMVLNIPASRQSLENLKYLEIGSNFLKLSILENLSKSCKQLKTIQIREENFHVIRQSFVSLICNQNRLENLIIFGNGVGNSPEGYNYDATISEIFSTLKTVAHSLKKLEISDVFVRDKEALKGLIQCTNLSTLHFENSFISPGNFQWIALAELPRLQCLKLIRNWSSDEETTDSQHNPMEEIFLNKRKSSDLKELSLKNFKMENFKLLEPVSSNCRNLVSLSVLVKTNEDISNISSLLKNLSTLEKLELSTSGPFTYDINTETIIDMAKILPKQLYYVNLIKIIDRLDDFEDFLENCAADLKYLYIEFSIYYFFKVDRHIEFVKNWSQKNGKETRLLNITWYHVNLEWC